MKKIIYTLFLSVITMHSMLLFSQGSDAQKAKQLMNNFEYVKAISMYNSYFSLHSPADEDVRNIASCYLMINDAKQAKEWISRLALKQNPLAKDVFMYGKLLKNEGQYNEAIEQFERYKKLEPTDKNADLQIQSSKDAKRWIANPELFDVRNVESLNSQNSDFGLIPFEKGFIFTSDRKNNSIISVEETHGWTGNPYLKLYQVEDASKPESHGSIDPLNDKYHNGPAQFSKTSNEIFFTRTKMVRVTKKNRNIDPTSWIENIEQSDYENRLEIYSAKLTDGKWATPTPFAYNKPEEYSIGHPVLSPDGSILYFVSDMSGGFGGTDIYYSIKNADGSWGQPQNAGKTINTAGKEMFPNIDSDGTLFFSSDGHPGMGGLDIFKTTGKKNQWSTPENLKAPINSSKDDFSIYYTEKETAGYFSSNRDGGKGSDDIYYFESAPPSQLYVAVITKTMDENNNIIPLDKVNVKMFSESNDKTKEDLKEVNGKFSTEVKCKDTYTFVGSKEGYYTKSKTILTECTRNQDTLFVELIMEKMEIGKTIALKNIYYDFDESFIRDDAKADLDLVVQIMKDNKDIIVELGSHTDARGTDEYNVALSQRRADAAVKYIINKGIDKTRIVAKGFGETIHLNNCKDDVECTEDEHQLNRRTEFKVTGYIDGKKQVIKSDI
ncbi:MAG: OmpA family protein [Bacteroidales bacterium]|nr:OmpA family protein [Bacteroidales bacterium]